MRQNKKKNYDGLEEKKSKEEKIVIYKDMVMLQVDTYEVYVFIPKNPVEILS